MTNYNTPEINQKFNEALQEAKKAVKAGSVTTVSISKGNEKMGEVKSVSLLPFVTCPARCKKTCAAECYAAKIANLRPSVLKAYANNTALAMLKPSLFWQGINYTMAGVLFFRFHVAGDIMNREYFENMVQACKNNPHCKVLVFTKRYEIVNNYIKERGPLPENMKLLFSGWQNLQPTNPHKLPETNVYNRKEAPAKNWLLCGGNCFECGCRGTGCWKAEKGEIIAFKKH